jgi:hypothetical protein
VDFLIIEFPAGQQNFTGEIAEDTPPGEKDGLACTRLGDEKCERT